MNENSREPTKTHIQWLYTEADDYDALHYCDAVESWDFLDTDYSRPKFTAACGLHARFEAPGMFARIGRLRCESCCAAVGITSGNGCPRNDESVRHVRQRAD